MFSGIFRRLLSPPEFNQYLQSRAAQPFTNKWCISLKLMLPVKITKVLVGELLHQDLNRMRDKSKFPLFACVIYLAGLVMAGQSLSESKLDTPFSPLALEPGFKESMSRKYKSSDGRIEQELNARCTARPTFNIRISENKQELK